MLRLFVGAVKWNRMDPFECALLYLRKCQTFHAQMVMCLGAEEWRTHTSNTEDNKNETFAFYLQVMALLKRLSSNN